MTSHRSREELGIAPGIDMHWDDWAVIAGAASPVWGTLLALAFGWPRRIGALFALGPIGGLLVAGSVHDQLRRWPGFPNVRAALIEVVLASLFVALVCITPLVRYYRKALPRN